MKRFNLLSLFLNILIILLIFSIFSNFYKHITINSKLKTGSKEIVDLEKQVEKIQEDIKFAETPEYIEKVARESLDMIKEGEFIIILDQR